jgi:hypothetical protein
MVRMGPVVRATEDPSRSLPTSRHLTSPLTVLRELRRCRLAWRSAPTRSHGGSQGFKSPHLHPTKPWSPAWRVISRWADVLLEPLAAENGQLPRRMRPVAARSAATMCHSRSPLDWSLVARGPDRRRSRRRCLQLMGCTPLALSLGSPSLSFALWACRLKQAATRRHAWGAP